jgi:hypothetical protein
MLPLLCATIVWVFFSYANGHIYGPYPTFNDCAQARELLGAIAIGGVPVKLGQCQALDVETSR